MVLRLENVMDVSARLKPSPQIEIHMAYLGNLSVNHYLGKSGKRFWVKKDVEQWMDELAWMVRVTAESAQIEFKPPVKVFISGVFKDGRAQPDLDNLLKVTADAVSDGLGIDDKHFIHETGSSEVQKFVEPKLIIRIKQGQGENNET